MRPALTVVALVLLFAALLGRAYDQALAGEPMVAATTVIPSAVPHGEQASPAGTTTRTASIRAIRQVFGTYGRPVAVARCESKLNPRAVSDTNDWGLFQLNRPTWDPALNPRARPYWPKGKDWRHVFDPVVNARVAWAISKRGTDFWTHWRWSAGCWA